MKCGYQQDLETFIKSDAFRKYAKNRQQRRGKGVLAAYAQKMAEVSGSVEHMLWEQLNSLLSHLKSAWQNKAGFAYPYHKIRGVEHSEVIIAFMEDMLFFYKDAKNGDDKVNTKLHKHVDLTSADVFLLLFAAYIHDIGKMLWNILLDPFLSAEAEAMLGKSWAEHKEELLNNPEVHEIDLKLWGTIEKLHPRILAIILDAVNEGVNAATWQKSVLSHVDDELVAFLTMLAGTQMDEKGRFSKHGQVNMLKTLRDIVVEHHGQIDSQHMQAGYAKVPLLTSLLVAADGLDTDRSRVDLQRIADVAKKHINPGAALIWSLFWFVEEARIESGEHEIAFCLKYQVPSALDPDNFLYMRAFIERDFMDLSFQRPIVESFHTVRFVHRYEVVVDDKVIPTRCGQDLLRVLRFIKGRTEELKELVEPSITKARVEERKGPFFEVQGSDELFSNQDTSDAIFQRSLIPKSRAMLYLLAVLYSYPNGIDKDQALHKTGLDSIEIMTAQLDSSHLLQIYGSVLELDHTNEDYEAMRRFLREYRLNPLRLKTKVDEYEKLQCILPFWLARRENIISTSVAGLDERVLCDISDSSKPGGFLPNRCILIEGAPGAGKTTLGLQILVANRRHLKRVALLTFEEDQNQLMDDFSKFEWEKEIEDAIFPIPGLVKQRMSEDRDNGTTKDLVRHIDRVNPEVLVIDSISRFREVTGSEDSSRRVLGDFFAMLRIRCISVFCLGEAGRDQDEPNRYEEYLADGIVRLKYEEGRRYLEIVKLRGQKYAKGKHAFKIVSCKEIDAYKKSGKQELKWLENGINVFPNLEAYSFQSKEPGGQGKGSGGSYRSSGIEALDRLLLESENKPAGFLKGNSVLVLGSPGVGKTLLGLYFLYGKNHESRGEKDEQCLWISFEGPREHLEKSVAGFADTVKMKVMAQDRHECMFHYFPLTTLNHLEFVYAVMEAARKKGNKPGISRLVIDCISDLESTFADSLEFKSFALAFIRLLSEHGVTSMLLYRLPKFFGSSDHPGIEITSVVDTIISLKSFDIANKIKKGLFLLKVRGRKHISDLQTVEISKEGGLEISQKGWTLEGLISGETMVIKEPPIFFKLFYENEAEKVINDAIIKEFSEVRYPPADRSFTSIRKPQLYAEFWSFRGQYGAGHANVRVVSLPAYAARAFSEKSQLHDLSDFFADAVKRRICAIDAWLNLSNVDEEKAETRLHGIDCDAGCKYYDLEKNVCRLKWYMVPNYADCSLMCWNNDVLSKLDPDWKVPSLVSKIKNDDVQWTWNNITDALIHWSNNSARTPDNSVLYGFAMPALNNISDFVGFFLELLYGYNGHISVSDNSVVIDIDAACSALMFMHNLVFKHKISPNPYGGDYSTRSLFFRKRYSSLRETRFALMAGSDKSPDEFFQEQLMQNPSLRPEWVKIPKDKIKIYNMPIVDSSVTSFSVYDVYTLGIVREALSPEIGWIFVDSLTHPEWVKKKIMANVGLPINPDDLVDPDLYKHDPDAFEALKRMPQCSSAHKGRFRRIDRFTIPKFFLMEPLIHDQIRKLFIPLSRGGVDPSISVSKLNEYCKKIMGLCVSNINKKLQENGHGVVGARVESSS